ncbi:hypothetical protein POM88_023565 [Heracleum sosnowskyi]|uniref:PPC domain-containing protein n=1 Tax=Heracleum sosnowskyi TaxID=360622 RepID=A0AAD8MQL7_9APIA|nr:hypothetical protein POM88_023565 [Heracleum sosnowskyi]
MLVVSLADLQKDEDQAYRKIRLRTEDVQGKNVLTNFWGMDFTTDKLRSLVRKWQTLIEAHVDVKTTDSYTLGIFCIGFTKKLSNQPVILDVPDGVDIIDWVAGFANSNKVCITVVGGFGKVSLAALSRLKSPAPPLLYIEHLTLINLSGTYQFSTLAEGSPTFINALLGRLNGAVIGGAASRMVVMGKVGLSAYVFQNPKIITIKTEFH